MKNIIQRIAITFIAVATSSLLRMAFLESLQSKLAWLTFYPAIMVAALFGGFFAGVLAAILSACMIIFGWHFFSNSPFITSNSDWLGLAVFVFNSILISAIAEYSRQQNLKAKKQAHIAELANKSKNTFLANMSHELRTPLNAILGYNKLIRTSKNISQDDLKKLDIVNKSGKHLLNLINNVLDIAKIEIGKFELKKTPCNLHYILSDVIELMEMSANLKGLNILFAPSDNLPTYIKTDESKFKQILLNLLGNAIKFTNKGEIELKIDLEESPISNKVLLLIEVRDTGIGIPKNDFKKIFNPFYQTANTEHQQGTGLGLAICKQFIEAFGGGISVKSELSKGSIFNVTIPVEIIEGEVELPLQNENDDFKILAPGQADKRILIVEDKEENWTLLQSILEKSGFKVKVATNGRMGVDMYNEWKPDFIWMDIRMPIMNGFEATRLIRETNNGKKVKIVGISAHVFEDGIKEVLNSGMNDFVKKPYEFNDIFSCMEKHLNVKYEETNEKFNTETLEEFSLQANKVPQEYIINLKDALLSLDTENINKNITTIKGYDSQLAKSLEKYASGLKYTELLQVVNNLINS